MVFCAQGAGPLRPRWSTPAVLYAMRCQLAAACLLLASSAAPTDLTLDGVVYVDRLAPADRAALAPALRELAAAYGPGGDEALRAAPPPR